MMAQKEFIFAYQAMFGGTKKEAIAYYKIANDTVKKDIIKWYKGQAKIAFYND